MSEEKKNSSDLAAVTWPWREAPPEPETPTVMVLIKWGIALGIANVFAVRGYTDMAWMIIGISSFVTFLGFVSPENYRKLENVLIRVGVVIGMTLGGFLLLLLFFTCMLLGRLVLLITRKDPMTRHPDPSVSTYWVDRGTTTRPEEFTRQF